MEVVVAEANLPQQATAAAAGGYLNLTHIELDYLRQWFGPQDESQLLEQYRRLEVSKCADVDDDEIDTGGLSSFPNEQHADMYVALCLGHGHDVLAERAVSEDMEEEEGEKKADKALLQVKVFKALRGLHRCPRIPCTTLGGGVYCINLEAARFFLESHFGLPCRISSGRRPFLFTYANHVDDAPHEHDAGLNRIIDNMSALSAFRHSFSAVRKPAFLYGNLPLPVFKPIVTGLTPQKRKAKDSDTPEAKGDSTAPLTERKEALSLLFQCCVCLGVMRDPATLPCGHAGCLDCLKQAFKRQFHKCPLCQAKLDRQTEEKLQVNVTLRAAILTLWPETAGASAASVPTRSEPGPFGAFSSTLLVATYPDTHASPLDAPVGTQKQAVDGVDAWRLDMLGEACVRDAARDAAPEAGGHVQAQFLANSNSSSSSSSASAAAPSLQAPSLARGSDFLHTNAPLQSVLSLDPFQPEPMAHSTATAAKEGSSSNSSSSRHSLPAANESQRPEVPESAAPARSSEEDLILEQVRAESMHTQAHGGMLVDGEGEGEVAAPQLAMALKLSAPSEKDAWALLLGAFHVGQRLDVLDSKDRWCEAEVLVIDELGHRVFVTFTYWESKWDEWISDVHERTAPLHAHTYYLGGQLKVGQRVEVMDSYKKWLEAFVIEEIGRDEVKVHFFGYRPNLDEVIPRDSSRIRPYGRDKVITKSSQVETGTEIGDQGSAQAALSLAGVKAIHLQAVLRRAGALGEDPEVYDVLRGSLGKFLTSLVGQAVTQCETRGSRVVQVCDVLASKPEGMTMLGYGGDGSVRFIWSAMACGVMSRVHPGLKLDPVSLSVVNDMNTFLLRLILEKATDARAQLPSCDGLVSASEATCVRTVSAGPSTTQGASGPLGDTLTVELYSSKMTEAFEPLAELVVCLSAADIEEAVRIVLPGELANHGASEACKAIARFASSGDTEAAWKNSSMAPRAGLLTPPEHVALIAGLLGLTRYPLTVVASVYLAAVLEYITAEVLELGGNAAKDNQINIVSCRMIHLAVRHDLELDALFASCIIRDSGVILRPVLGKFIAQGEQQGPPPFEKMMVLKARRASKGSGSARVYFVDPRTGLHRGASRAIENESSFPAPLLDALCAETAAQRRALARKGLSKKELASMTGDSQSVWTDNEAAALPSRPRTSLAAIYSSRLQEIRVQKKSTQGCLPRGPLARCCHQLLNRVRADGSDTRPVGATAEAMDCACAYAEAHIILLCEKAVSAAVEARRCAVLVRDFANI